MSHTRIISGAWRRGTEHGKWHPDRPDIEARYFQIDSNALDGLSGYNSPQMHEEICRAFGVSPDPVSETTVTAPDLMKLHDETMDMLRKAP